MGVVHRVALVATDGETAKVERMKAVKLSPIKNCENGYALLHRFENASVECRIIERNRHGSVLIIYLSEGISCERKRIRRRSLRTEPLERTAKQAQCDGSLYLSRIYLATNVIRYITVFWCRLWDKMIAINYKVRCIRPSIQ